MLKQAEAEVSATGPKVIAALGKVKFLLITIPIICVVVAVMIQVVTKERNIGTIAFKMGTFATPQSPTPVMLAGENQVRLRLRQFADEIREQHPGSLLIATFIENDVVTVTGIDSGDFGTKLYLKDLVQKEIDFQNVRLEKLQRIQDRRMQSLRETVENNIRQRSKLQLALEKSREPIAMLSMQQGIDNASSRISTISKELDTHDLLNASDLFVDTTQVIRTPVIIASSNWYRPVFFGIAGLIVGLFLTLIIAIFAVFKAFSGKGKESEDDHVTSASD